MGDESKSHEDKAARVPSLALPRMPHAPLRREASLYALLIAISVAALGLADLHSTYAQPAPAIPTVQIAAPLSGPQLLLPIASETTTPTASQVPDASPLLPTATATPGPAPEETLPKDASLSYRIQGALTLTTQSEAGSPATQRRGFEVIVASAALGEDTATIRQLRLWPIDQSNDMDAITVYELDNAVMTVAGDNMWSIRTRNWRSPMAQALQPVLDIGALAYEICSRAASATPTVDEDGLGTCTLENAAGVANFLTQHNPELRLTTSTLVADLDRVEQRTQRMALTADLTSVLDSGTSYRIEWTYELDALDEADDVAFRSLQWSAGLPRIEEMAVPGFGGDSLPSPERIMGIERYSDAVRILYSLSQTAAKESMRVALGAGGWIVRNSGNAFVARQDDQWVVVFVSDDGNATAVDIVRTQ